MYLEELTDIGKEHHIKYVFDGDGKPFEIIEYHFDTEGKMCGGIVALGPGEWELVSDEPVTVKPSIDCDRCPSHGFILEGRWVDHLEPDSQLQCAKAWGVPEEHYMEATTES